MKENVKFITRVMVIHVLTYCVCGVVFMALFDYEALYQLGNIKYFMHPVGSTSTFVGPVFQIVRGLLFGFILLLIKENVIQKKHGWLRLWIIIVGIGIINTPGPAPCSIEGIIYTQLPLEFHIKGAPEILIQTLLFSYLVANPEKFKSQGVRKHKIPLISAAVAGFMFSLSGVILALILHLDMTAGMTDIGAFIVMFVAVASVFLVSKWYLSTTFRLKHIVLPLSCYIVLAIIPTIYNYMVDSVFASLITLGINVIPVIVIFLINYISMAKALRGVLEPKNGKEEDKDE